MIGLARPPLLEISLVLGLLGTVALPWTVGIYNRLLLAMRRRATTPDSSSVVASTFRYGRAIADEAREPSAMQRLLGRLCAAEPIAVPTFAHSFVLVWLCSLPIFVVLGSYSPALNVAIGFQMTFLFHVIGFSGQMRMKPFLASCLAVIHSVVMVVFVMAIVFAIYLWNLVTSFC